jgi:aspartate/methionine/tyrosine aminotransferase
MGNQGFSRRCKHCSFTSPHSPVVLSLSKCPQGRSKNKIRSVVAGLDLSNTQTDKALINLGLGDPTVFGLHDPPKVALEAMQDALMSGSANGYVPGTGLREACQAVADYHKRWDQVEYVAEDVTLVSSYLQVSLRGIEY